LARSVSVFPSSSFFANRFHFHLFLLFELPNVPDLVLAGLTICLRELENLLRIPRFLSSAGILESTIEAISEFEFARLNPRRRFTPGLFGGSRSLVPASEVDLLGVRLSFSPCFLDLPDSESFVLRNRKRCPSSIWGVRISGGALVELWSTSLGLDFGLFLIECGLDFGLFLIECRPEGGVEISAGDSIGARVRLELFFVFALL
jgi:hypothetical protein